MATAPSPTNAEDGFEGEQQHTQIFGPAAEKGAILHGLPSAGMPPSQDKSRFSQGLGQDCDNRLNFLPKVDRNRPDRQPLSAWSRGRTMHRHRTTWTIYFNFRDHILWGHFHHFTTAIDSCIALGFVFLHCIEQCGHWIIGQRYQHDGL